MVVSNSGKWDIDGGALGLLGICRSFLISCVLTVFFYCGLFFGVLTTSLLSVLNCRTCKFPFHSNIFQELPSN